MALLVEYYSELPPLGSKIKDRPPGSAHRRAALDAFKTRVQTRYNEGTLQRLLTCGDVTTRRAAVLALGLIGTMHANAELAGRLHDEDASVRRMAADGLWALWFRADSDANNQELHRLSRLGDAKKALAGFRALLKKSPRFAEVYNQRAVLNFRMGEFQAAISDCEIVLRLNPYHFGALAGMGQSYMKLKKPRLALKAFRAAMHVNPGLEGVEEAIQFLEDALGEEGKKDDKK